MYDSIFAKQSSILLKNLAARLKTVRQNIMLDLPSELSHKRTVKPVIRFPNTPESWEITDYPILNELDSFISEIEDDAKQLKQAAIKQKGAVG